MVHAFEEDNADDNDRDLRVARLQRTLMESSDDGLRASAHLELARMALTDGQVESSARHLKEALLLEPRLEAAKTLLTELGDSSRGPTERRVNRGTVRGLLGKLRRK